MVLSIDRDVPPVMRVLGSIGGGFGGLLFGTILILVYLGLHHNLSFTRVWPASMIGVTMGAIFGYAFPKILKKGAAKIF